MSLTVRTIHTVASLCHNTVELFETAIPNEMVQVDIHNFQSNYVTLEEQALGWCKWKHLLIIEWIEE